MAERRAAGFNIPLNFYDGPEVDSIPKRIRAAAIGVWALAGDYAATQLSDGYVPAGVLKSFGCTAAIRAALKVTINKKGELSPLWVDAPHGGIQLTNWPKHQRTNDEVTTYRAKDAERKRLAREAKELRTNDGNNAYLIETNDELTSKVANKKGERVAVGSPSSSDNAETSARTQGGRPRNVRSTETETETETELSTSVVTKGVSVQTVAASETHTPPSKFCDRHPNGTRKPCGDCGNARTAHKAWIDAQDVATAAAAADELDTRRRQRELAANCPICHGTNWIPDTEPAVKCTHQEATHA